MTLRLYQQENLNVVRNRTVPRGEGQADQNSSRDDQLISAYQCGYRAGVQAAITSIQTGPGATAREWWDERHGRQRRRGDEQ